MELELTEFLRMKESEEKAFFNKERTLMLINLYKKYKEKVGTYEIKTMKRMWEIVAMEMSNKYHVTISATKCENRWKVLERNYKAVLDNNNKTGRGRKFCEYENELDEIYRKKKNVHPVILLSSEKIVTAKPITSKLLDQQPSHFSHSQVHPADISQPSTSQHHNRNQEEEINVMLTIADEIENQPPNQLRNPITPLYNKKRKRSTSSYQKRNDILTEMKNDLKNYYTKKIEIEEKKLEIAQRKQTDREKRTNLYEDHVKLLNEQLLNNNFNSRGNISFTGNPFL